MNKNHFEEIITYMPGHVYWKDTHCVLQGCNEALAEYLGFKSPKEIIGKTDFDLVSPEEAELIRQFDFGVMASNTERVTEENYTDVDGKKIIFLSRKVPLHNEVGEVAGIVGISFDITAERESEKLKAENLVLERQVELFKQLSATVAHELRTPLKGIELGVEFYEEYMPKLFNAAKLSIKNQLVTGKETIPDRVLKSLEETTRHIKQEIQASFLFISMLLTNIQSEGVVTGPYEKLKIVDVITDALNRYPFDDIQKNQVHADLSHGFVFKGNHDLLVHIFFNLLKNGLYYLAAAGKGEIKIWCEEKGSVNELHFKDTGAGISKEILPHIFEQFFSKTLHGTGIGLTYCKIVMNALGGDIICQSIEGEYTEFILSFPKLTE